MFMIDLIALANSSVLNHMIKRIFENPKSTIIGYRLEADLYTFTL